MTTIVCNNNCPTLLQGPVNNKSKTCFVIVVNVDNGWTSVRDDDLTLQNNRPATLKRTKLHVHTIA